MASSPSLVSCTYAASALSVFSSVNRLLFFTTVSCLDPDSILASEVTKLSLAVLSLEIEGIGVSRITSYNVCYTKLLRP